MKNDIMNLRSKNSRWARMRKTGIWVELASVVIVKSLSRCGEFRDSCTRFAIMGPKVLLPITSKK